MNNRSGKKSGLVIIMLILLIIVMLGVGIYVYFVTDLLKTPEQLFKKYFLSNVFQLTTMNFEPFTEINSRSETEVTEYNLNVKVNEMSGAIEGNYDVNLTLTTDIPNRNEDLELLINKDENEFFKGTLALTDETLGLNVPDLYDKYIAVENRDLKNIAKTFELSDEFVQMIPDKIPSGLSPEDEEKINMLATKYVTKITDQFDENTYMAEKNINVNVNSHEITTNKYTLTVSSKKIYTAITGAVTELLDDPEFLALCEGRVQTEQLDKLKTSYQEMLNETLVEDIEDTLIRFSVYAAKGKTVKTELKVDDNEAYIAIADNAIICSTIEPKNDLNDVGITSIAIIKNTFENGTGELVYELETVYNKDDITDLQTEYDAKYGDSEYGNYFTKDYNEIYKDSKIKYTISTKKINENTIKGEILIDVGEEIGIMDLFDISFKCQFGKGKVEILSEENAEIINDYTMEDYQNLLTSITMNLMSIAFEKPDSLIGMIFTSQGQEDDYVSTGDDFTSDDYTSDDYTTSDDFYSSDDYTSDDYTSDFEDITFPEDEYNNNYMNPTTSFDVELTRNNIDWDITDGLTKSLDEYKAELLINENANLGDFLTVDNVQKYCGDKYRLELLDSTTIKCIVLGDVEYVYYALMNIDGGELVVTEVEVLTEEEYINR